MESGTSRGGSPDPEKHERYERGEDQALRDIEEEAGGGDAPELAQEKELTRLIQQLKRVVDEERRKSEDYLTRLKYLQADFENYRKRVDREIREIEEFSTSRFAKRLLPILDELDLALNSAESKSPLTEGVKMVRKNLNAALEAEGVKRIEALGKPFDPALHEAVDKVLGKRSGGEDIVVEEIRKGYLFKDKILRPSMVKVEVGMKGEARTEKEEEEEERKEGGLT